MVETTIPFKTHAFYEISQHRYVIARILEGKRMRRRPSETRRTTQEKNTVYGALHSSIRANMVQRDTTSQAPHCGILCARRQVFHKSLTHYCQRRVSSLRENAFAHDVSRL